MDKDSAPLTWSKAADQALDALGRAVLALIARYMTEDDPLPPDVAMGDVSAAAGRLQRILGAKHPFAQGNVLAKLVAEELSSDRTRGVQSLAEKYELAYPLILARVKAQAQRWRFAVPLPTWARARSLGPFGGGMLEVQASEQDIETMDLVGVVEGPLLSADAAKETERRALEFFGACIDLGLAAFQEAPPGWWNYDERGTEIRLVLEAVGSTAYSPMSHGLWGLTARVSFGGASPFLRLTDLEKHALSADAHAAPGGIATRLLGRLFAGDSARHLELRNACRLFLEAYGAADHGTSVLYGFLCLEGVLLEARSKADVLARLTEAVAYRVGRSAGERQDLRRLLKQLYDERSTYVHTGRLQPRDADAQQWNDLLARVLHKEIAELDT